MEVSAESVADAPHRGEGQVVAELLAQLADVDVDGAVVAGPVDAPHPVDQLLAGQGDALVARQEGQQIELPGGEGDGLATTADLAAGGGPPPHGPRGDGPGGRPR